MLLLLRARTQTQRQRTIPPSTRWLLPLMKAAPRELNLWCAAASTGQEPYSLAMLLQDHFGATIGWDCRLLASDFSSAALQRAVSVVREERRQALVNIVCQRAPA